MMDAARSDLRGRWSTSRGCLMETLSEIAQLRLQNQRLIGTPFATPEDAVRWFGAIQSQDYGGAKWGIGQRTEGAADAALDRAFDDGAILRTHAMRPTWHFVLPADIRWLQMLTAPRVHVASAFMYRKLELDAAIIARSNALIAGALRGSNQLTRNELGDALARGGIAASGQRLAYFVMHAELDALICSGARRGKQFTYALLDERVPATPARDRDEALAELMCRYFTSHGPATVHDCAWWSGLTIAEVKRGIALVAPPLAHAEIAGKTYWFAPATTTARFETPIIHLLPNYDEHLVAYRDHRASFDAALYGNVPPTSAALLANIVVRDGNVIGGWKHAVKAREIVIATDLLVALDRAESAALRDAVDTYSRFMGLPVTVQ